MEGLVSIITPCFNNATMVAETIRSVVEQSYPYWELICVDDGSTDNTCNIISEFCKQCHNIKLIKREREPKGGSVCRNIGIEHAKGEYIVFLDADDILHVDCLKNRVESIIDTDLDFVVFPNATIKKGVIGKVTSDFRIKKHFLAFSSNHAAWQTTCPLYRISFVKSIGGFDETFPRLQDVEFGIRCLAESSGNYASFLQRSGADCFYRISENKQSFTKKYDLAFSTLPKLYALVERLFKEEKYNKNDFSKVLLCMILSSIMISQSTSHKQSYKDIFPQNIFKYLLISDSFWLKVLDLTKNCGAYYCKLAHLLRYIILRLYY